MPWSDSGLNLTGPTGPQGETGPPGTTVWSGIFDKPETFTPSAHTHTKTEVGLENVDNTSDADKPISSAAQTAIDSKEDQSNKGQANGYASLDSGGKVPASQLPSSIMDYQGTYNASSNSPSLSDSSGNAGDVYRVSVAGSRDFGSGTITLRVGDYIIYSGSVWQKSSTTDAVASVAGKTGDVTLTASDVTGVVTTGGALGTPTSGNVSSCIGQVADLSIVGFSVNTSRALGLGDFPFGVKLQRAVSFSSVTYRAYTADASGNLVVELRKNGSTVSGSSATIAYTGQVAGGTATGTWDFAVGDIVTVYITAVGGTPGKGLIADIKGMTIA